MKVYILFKLKDPKARKKEWIVDKVYNTLIGAERRERRLHQHRGSFLRIFTDGVIKSEYQQTYIINKTLKGLINDKAL